MTKLFYSLLVFVAFTSQAFALDLQSARSSGIVIEQPDGYIKAAKVSDEAKKLVEEVNAARKQEYERISKENGQPVDMVAKIAAEAIAKKMKSGN